MMGIADLPKEILRALHIKPSHHASAEASVQMSSRSSTTDVQSKSHEPSTPVTDQSLDGNNLISPNTSKTSFNTTGSRNLMSVTTQSPDEINLDTVEKPSKPSEPRSSGSASDRGHRKSMAQILGTSASRSSSRGRSSIDSSSKRSLSEARSSSISLETAVDTGKGIGRIVGAGLKSPMDFTLSLARGFHNAPKLYGDDMVRHPDKVTGIRSGFKAAGKVHTLKNVNEVFLLLTQNRSLAMGCMMVYLVFSPSLFTERNRKDSVVSLRAWGRESEACF